MIHQYKLLFARTCSFGLEHPEVTDWLFQMAATLANDPRCAGTRIAHHTEHRIHCGRNFLTTVAVENGFDYMCFVDGDMHPDFRLWQEGVPDDRQLSTARKWAKPFLKSSLDFMMTERCGVVAAPAVSGPPANKLNVFVLREQGDTPVTRMTHDEYRNTPPSMKQVYAIGTGLMLVDVNVFRAMKQPWFSDAYDEANKQLEVRLSQDCNFCSQCNNLGFPVYANMYSPAGHIKYQRQEPPEPIVFGPQAAA